MNVNFKSSINQGKSLRFLKSNDGKKTLLRPINIPTPPLFEITETGNIALLMHLNGSNNSTTFIDNSLNKIPLTGFLHTFISTGDYKFGGASVIFNGPGAGEFHLRSYIGTDNSSIFNFTSGNPWTLECWVNPTSLPTDTKSTIFSNCRMDSPGINYEFSIAPTGSIQTNKLYLNGNLFETGEIPINTWTHIAFSYDGNLTHGFINGIKAGEKNIHINVTNNNYNRILFGSIKLVGIYERLHFEGYMDEIRITTGVARYINNFAPPTDEFSNPPYDPYINNVSLLLHMDGENESTNFIDSSINNFSITTVGNTNILQNIKKFGSGAGYFDGSGDYLDVPLSSNFDFGNENFTIEFWVYNTTTNFRTCIARWGGGGNAFYIGVGTNDGIGLYVNDSNPAKIVGGTIPINQWAHIAIVRNGTEIKAYINGSQVGNTFNIGTNAINSSSHNLRIGRDHLGNPFFEGYMDEIRITKGIARYVSNFTPPTNAFPNP